MKTIAFNKAFNTIGGPSGYWKDPKTLYRMSRYFLPFYFDEFNYVQPEPPKDRDQLLSIYHSYFSLLRPSMIGEYTFRFPIDLHLLMPKEATYDFYIIEANDILGCKNKNKRRVLMTMAAWFEYYPNFYLRDFISEYEDNLSMAEDEADGEAVEIYKEFVANAKAVFEEWRAQIEEITIIGIPESLKECLQYLKRSRIPERKTYSKMIRKMIRLIKIAGDQRGSMNSGIGDNGLSFFTEYAFFSGFDDYDMLNNTCEMAMQEEAVHGMLDVEIDPVTRKWKYTGGIRVAYNFFSLKLFHELCTLIYDN